MKFNCVCNMTTMTILDITVACDEKQSKQEYVTLVKTEVFITGPTALTLWQAERHFCHLRFTGAATILSFFRSILLAWILLAKLSVNVQ